MDDAEKRALTAERKLTFAMLKKYPELKEGAVDYLLAEARKTAEFTHHVRYGDTLELSEIVGACERSPTGQLVFADREEEKSGPVDHDQEIEDMTAEQKLIYARKHGLK